MYSEKLSELLQLHGFITDVGENKLWNILYYAVLVHLEFRLKISTVSR